MSPTCRRCGSSRLRVVGHHDGPGRRFVIGVCDECGLEVGRAEGGGLPSASWGLDEGPRARSAGVAHAN